MPQTTLKDLEKLASTKAAEHGFNVCSFKLFGNNSPITMQVHIQHAEGGDVSLQDCANFSGYMNDAIEASEIQVNEGYILEISSPGLSDQLETDRDFQTFRGFPVEIIYKDKGNDELRENGLLHERSHENVQINIKGKIIRIPRDDVLQVSLIHPKG